MKDTEKVSDSGSSDTVTYNLTRDCIIFIMQETFFFPDRVVAKDKKGLQ